LIEPGMAAVTRGLKRALYRLVLRPTFRLEDELSACDDVIAAGPGSPRRIEIIVESMAVVGTHRPMPGFPRSLPHVLSSARGMRASLRETIDDRAQRPRPIGLAGRHQLEAFMRLAGVDLFGYTTIAPRLIFQGKAVRHANVIVLAMEMDRARMDNAPSPDTAVMVHETYDRLGFTANRIARYLRARGYPAQAGHPLGGPVLYPPLAQAAGLGWLGRHGLLITPEFGPRVRLAAVFTAIEDLPDTSTDRHAWIGEFCRDCGKCLRTCPVRAIRDVPRREPGGRESCVDPSRCLPFFVRHDGCSICIARCPFHQRDHAWLRSRWQRHGGRAARLRADPPPGFPGHLRAGQPPVAAGRSSVGCGLVAPDDDRTT
jgi:epoxyqueuosine reductase